MGAEPERLTEATQLDAVRGEALAVIYKHSPLCGVSSMARQEIRSFMDAHPDVPLYEVDVVRDRSLSRAVERAFGVRHQSPQALVLRQGEVVWHGSHGAVSRSALERETGV